MHGKPPELWLPLRLQRLRSPSIENYILLCREPPTDYPSTNQLTARRLQPLRCPDAFLIGLRVIVRATFLPSFHSFLETLFPSSRPSDAKLASSSTMIDRSYRCSCDAKNRERNVCKSAGRLIETRRRDGSLYSRRIK